jgi:lysophospholipase L1-like esterase
LGVRVLHLAPVIHRLRSGVAESAYERSENPRLGYVFKKGYRSAVANLHESFPTTNLHGQRDVERRFEKIPGVPRIVMLGDSVVAGHGIFDVQHTLPLSLERESGERKIEVLNFGVGGYCTAGEVELLKEKGLAYQPDLVTLIFVSNDYAPLNSQTGKYGYDRPGYVETLFVHSDLFRHVSLSTNFMHFRDQLEPNYWLDQNALHLGEDSLRRALRDMKDLSVKHGFKTLIAIWPTFSDREIHDDSHPREAGSQHLLVEDVIQSLGMRSVRLSTFFKQDYAARCGLDPTERSSFCAPPMALYTIGDGMHPSVLGTQVAAQALLPLIREYVR